LGGVLVVDGQPVRGARGRGGEFGHLPFGDPRLECPCGAHGCWGRTVDGEALARLIGEPRPADPELYARHALVARAAGSHAAVQEVARALGAGIAGLVNAHDPDVVTLSGLAPLARAAAPDAFSEAYHGGLMRTFRDAPPPVYDSAHDDSGPARGALSLGFDHITSPAELADWVERCGPR
jgi:predicted NBD/HSP70 family sugar kinase